MKRIPLTHRGAPAGFALVDDADYEWLCRWRWRWDGRYAVRTVSGMARSLAMHRAIRGLWFGDEPEIDHWNGDGRDNRRSNLRVVTRARNAQNLAVRCDSKTGVRGVSWCTERGKFFACVRLAGRSKNLGRYETLSEAASAVARFRAEYMPDSNEERHQVAA